MASHLFKVANLKQMLDVFIEHGHKFSKFLESYAESGHPFDAQDYFSRLTMDAIGKIAFGYNFDTLNKTDVPFANAFDQAQISIAERILNPFWNLKLVRMFMPTEKSLHEAIKVMDDFAYKIIRERKDDPDLPNKNDLLSQYLKMSKFFYKFFNLKINSLFLILQNS